MLLFTPSTRAHIPIQMDGVDGSWVCDGTTISKFISHDSNSIVNSLNTWDQCANWSSSENTIEMCPSSEHFTYTNEKNVSNATRRRTWIIMTENFFILKNAAQRRRALDPVCVRWKDSPEAATTANEWIRTKCNSLINPKNNEQRTMSNESTQRTHAPAPKLNKTMQLQSSRSAFIVRTFTIACTLYLPTWMERAENEMCKEIIFNLNRAPA